VTTRSSRTRSRIEKILAIAESTPYQGEYDAAIGIAEKLARAAGIQRILVGGTLYTVDRIRRTARTPIPWRR
jgi:hypothetical protein